MMNLIRWALMKARRISNVYTECCSAACSLCVQGSLPAASSTVVPWELHLDLTLNERLTGEEIALPEIKINTSHHVCPRCNFQEIQKLILSNCLVRSLISLLNTAPSTGVKESGSFWNIREYSL